MAGIVVAAPRRLRLSLERDVTAVVKANGGKVLGAVRHPLELADAVEPLLGDRRAGGGKCRHAQSSRPATIIGKRTSPSAYDVTTVGFGFRQLVVE